MGASGYGKRHGAACIVCPLCRMVSHNSDDVLNEYCGNCHLYHDQMEHMPQTYKPRWGEYWAATKRFRGEREMGGSQAR